MNAFEKSNFKLSTMVARIMQMNRFNSSSPSESIAHFSCPNREKNRRGCCSESGLFGGSGGDGAYEQYDDEKAPSRNGVYQETVLDPRENINSETVCVNLSFGGAGDDSVMFKTQTNLLLSHRGHCIRQETGTRQEKRDEYQRYLNVPDWAGCCEPKPTGCLKDLGPQRINTINALGFSPREDRGDCFQGGYHG